MDAGWLSFATKIHLRLQTSDRREGIVVKGGNDLLQISHNGESGRQFGQSSRFYKSSTFLLILFSTIFYVLIANIKAISLQGPKPRVVRFNAQNE